MTTNLDSNKLLVNIMEAASLLSVGRSTIYALAKSGELQTVKIGSAVRVTMESIRALAGKGAAA